MQVYSVNKLMAPSLAAACLACVPASRGESPAANEESPASKKGWAGGKPEAAELMHCSWFYDWGLKGRSRPGLEMGPW